MDDKAAQENEQNGVYQCFFLLLVERFLNGIGMHNFLLSRSLGPPSQCVRGTPTTAPDRAKVIMIPAHQHREE
eukprot:3231166-Amphidinium_carterae.1